VNSYHRKITGADLNDPNVERDEDTTTMNGQDATGRITLSATDGTGDQKFVPVSAQNPGSASAQGGGATQPGSAGGNGTPTTPDQKTISATREFGDGYHSMSPQKRLEELDRRGATAAIAEDSGRRVEDVRNTILEVLSDPEKAEQAAQLRHVARTMILRSQGMEKEGISELMSMLGNKKAAIDYLIRFYMAKGMTEEEAKAKAEALYGRLTNLSMKDMLLAGLLLWYTDLSMEDIDNILAAEEAERNALLLQYLENSGLSSEDAEQKLQEIISELNRINSGLTSDILSDYGFTEDEVDYINNIDTINILMTELGISEFTAKLIIAYDRDQHGDLAGSNYFKFLEPVFSCIPENLKSELSEAILLGLYSGRLTPDNAEEYIKNLIEEMSPTAPEEPEE
ncbi:MAG: hypothetical protein PHQ54_03020, partial [Candidatus Omnitrophica bacterium]|nr:hypothetical protein [Candidatus Omnitrophota bacterium]